MLFIGMAFLVSACAVPYQQSLLHSSWFHLTPGYYEDESANGEYRVGFEANQFTPITMAADYALLRCAELAIEKGASHFEAESVEAYSVDGYRSEYKIRLHGEEPKSPRSRVFDALEVAADIRARYGLESD